MPKVSSLVLEILVPAFKSVGKAEMKIILSTVKEHNSPVAYESVLKGIHVNFGILREVAARTKTKFDDGIIDLVLEAVKESAESSEINILTE